MEFRSISVRVHLNAKKSILVQTNPSRYEAWIKAKPIDGRANEELIALLVKQCGISRSNIRLVKGRSGRHKVFRIFG